MASLTDTAENRLLNFATGNTTTAPTLPLRIYLLTANGTDAAAGTEVAGSAYVRKDVTVGAATNGQATNTATVRWDSLDPTNSITITGVEIWDNATTPVRWWHGALSANRTVAAADPVEIQTGALTLSLT